MKRLLCVLGIGVGVLVVGCAEDSTGPTTGSITLQLVSPPASVNAGSLARAPAEPASHLQSLRVTVDGPTPKTQTFPCTSSSCEGTIEGLAPGSYSVTVEGLVGTEVAHFGQTSGVQVVAGETATATLSLPSFQPVLLSLPDTTEVLHFPVSFQAVSGATSYVVEWAKSSTFSGASSVTLTGTSTEITVTEEAQYHVRVRAVNDQVATNGQWSAPGAVVALQGVATVSVTPADPTIAAGATQQFSAAAVDADGNPVPNVSFFWSSSNHNVATVNQSGLATGVSGGQITITAVGKGQPGGTTLNVGTQAATKLAFTAQPTNAVAGEAVSPAIQVEIQDANGNRVTSSRDAITLAIGTNPGSGTLAGTKVVNAIDGIASFSGIWIDKVGSGYTLAASSGSLTGATSSAFGISPGPKARLKFAVQPPNGEGNSAFTTEVSITDAFGNVVLTATDPVTVEIDRRPLFGASAKLGGTPTRNAVTGVSVFDNLTVDVAGAGYTLRARSGELTVASSAEFTVSLTFAQISAGYFHTCGVTTNGSAYCWGNNGSGELGNGTFQSDSVPRLVSGGLDFAQVSGGSGFTCGVTTGDDVYCWGANFGGQLGIGIFGGSRAEPTQVQDPAGGPVVFTQVAAGGQHACAVTQVMGLPGPAFCWGQDFRGQIGDDVATAQVNVPTIVTGGSNWKQITVGGEHTCAVHSNDTGYCWGRNLEGEIGNNTTTTVSPFGIPTPTQMTTLGIAETRAGEFHVCLRVIADATIRCWGFNGEGQVGVGNFNLQPDDIPISSQLSWTAVAAGGRSSCMLASTVAYCVGWDAEGQLGNGDPLTSIAVREQVLGSISFTSLTVGNRHTCGLNAVGKVWCWGRGANGQLGNGTRVTPKSQPVAIIQ